MEVTMDRMVEAVAALEEATVGNRRSPFHLSACDVCGAPTFCYPCPNCRAWCDFSDTPDQRQSQRDAALKSGVGTKDSFIERVEKEGGVGPWYFANFRRMVAYETTPSYKHGVEEAIARAKAIEWPSAGDVWDAVRARRKFPEDGEWARSLRAFEARADAEFGLRVEKLRAFRESNVYREWPVNCEEGRALLRTYAEERLVEMGLSHALEGLPGPA